MNSYRKPLAFLIMLPVLILNLSGTWQQDLVEYYPQPVMTNGSNDAYYPSVIFDPGHFGEDTGDMIRTGPETYIFTPYYKMWFSNGSGCGFAYSPDGISWTISTTGVTGLSNPHHVSVLYNSGNYYI